MNYSSGQCKQIVEDLLKSSTPTTNKQTEDQEENKQDGVEDDDKLIANITESMAQIWTVKGYRSLSKIEDKTEKSTPSQAMKRSASSSSIVSNQQTCARQASSSACDSNLSIAELSAYFDETLFLPKKMSFMAEMMYT